MNKIVLRQTSIIINNYELGDCPRLENLFSIYDPVYHTRYIKGIEYDKENKQLYLPRGMDVHWIESLFCENAYVDRGYDPFDYTGPVMIKYTPRDDDQKEALRFMIGVQEYERLANINQKSLCLNTGVGKTYVSIATIAYLNIKSIVITSSVNWLNQWKKCFKEYTDISPSEIYFISGSSAIHRLIDRDISKYKIYLVSHSTLLSYAESNGWEAVHELFKTLRVGIKIYDEAHLNFDNIYKIDYHTNTYMTFYVTATPARSDRKENIIYQQYFKNVPAIDLFDDQEDPHTQYISFKYNSHPTPEEISQCKNMYGLDRNKYVGYVVEKENFQYMLHILMDKMINVHGKVLVYIGTNASIDYIYNWIKEWYPDIINHVGIYTSLTPKDIKDEVLRKKIILSTTKSCGAAMDIKDLKMTVVLAEPFKSEVLARQTLGRTRGDNTIYIDIVDTGFSYTKRFYEYKKPVFAKYATKCTEVTINDIELEETAGQLMEEHQKYITPAVFLK